MRRQCNVAAIDMNFVISHLQFPDCEGSFRMVSSLVEDGLALKLEKLKSGQQWQVTVKDIGDHGPSGIPKEAVFVNLKVNDEVFLEK